MSVQLKMRKYVGEFAENKDIARDLRVTILAPAVDAGETVEVDFRDVAMATQSFLHALLSDVIRRAPDRAFDLMSFKNCSQAVKSTITLVAEYMQDAADVPRERGPAELAMAGKARTSGKRKRRARKK